MKKGEMEIEIETVPLSGKPKKEKYAVPMTCTTVGEIVSKTNHDLKNKNVTVNGKPATKETIVHPGDLLGMIAIRVTERPQSS